MSSNIKAETEWTTFRDEINKESCNRCPTEPWSHHPEVRQWDWDTETDYGLVHTHMAIFQNGVPPLFCCQEHAKPKGSDITLTIKPLWLIRSLKKAAFIQNPSCKVVRRCVPVSLSWKEFSKKVHFQWTKTQSASGWKAKIHRKACVHVDRA